MYGGIIIHLIRNQNKRKQKWANQCKIIACLLRESSQSFSDAIAIKLFRRLVSCCWPDEQWWNCAQMFTNWQAAGGLAVNKWSQFTWLGIWCDPRNRWQPMWSSSFNTNLMDIKTQGKIGSGIWVWSTLCSHPVTSSPDRQNRTRIELKVNCSQQGWFLDPGLRNIGFSFLSDHRQTEKSELFARGVVKNHWT